MIKKIPFELFEKDQTIYFDIPRLLEFERKIGRSLMPQEFLANPALNFNEIVAGLTVGLQQHYAQKTHDAIIEKISSYLQTGGGIGEFSEPILKAIIASGIYSKAFADALDSQVQANDSEKNG